MLVFTNKNSPKAGVFWVLSFFLRVGRPGFFFLFISETPSTGFRLDTDYLILCCMPRGEKEEGRRDCGEQ